MKKTTIIALAGLMLSATVMAQKTNPADSLMNAMNKDTGSERVTIFKSSRMVLLQSTEMIKKNNLNFLVIHRFGDFAGKSGGGQTYFGLDAVNDVYLGLEYGISDNFNIDIGRSTIGGLADLELKYAVLHQTTNGGSPIAITLIGEGGVRPYRTFNSFSDRLSYFGQAIFARKFGPAFSMQLAPAYVRNNTPMPAVTGAPSSFFALAGTARFKISNRAGLIIDYAKNFSDFAKNNSDWSDPLGVGFEIETGGHVFTMNVTNARAVNEINYLSAGQGMAFGRGQYRLGFTISRMFDFNGGHKKKDKE
ncbi:hypothetical protein HQ865_09250 [Mucilaginibacter mali]|uniref:DUF5777 domain-containing protein n=1 Tax=Mucilaginibacter mali TaxID=2740462 RepID=A0A7D4TNJ3_9SPHI|nr:DUF5777 family beta-barrel protein [Mucilaginibacter mali]QKJ29934.1 hypothetical protein HQ865_09250 [Mucilaginibacter mali]